MDGACATRSEDSWVTPPAVLLCIAWGPGQTRVLTARLVLQRAGKGQSIHEEAGQRFLNMLLFPLLRQNTWQKPLKERFIWADNLRVRSIMTEKTEQ